MEYGEKYFYFDLDYFIVDYKIIGYAETSKKADM